MSTITRLMKEYKQVIVEILVEDYEVPLSHAQKMLRDYDFNSLCKKCNYIVLHDDPDYWAERIYDYFQ